MFGALLSTAATFQLPYSPAHVATRTARSSVLARTEEGIKLELDLKGNPVWDLRIAVAEDSDGISALSDGVYSQEVVSTLVSSGMCLVGESQGKVITAALVHTFKELKNPSAGINGGLDQHAELLTVLGAKGISDELREKTVLGCMRTLKLAGFTDLLCNIDADDIAAQNFVTKIGCQEKVGLDKQKTFTAPLFVMNPDPRKKIRQAS